MAKRHIMVWDVYKQAIELFGLEKAVADESGEIVIRLRVGDIVRVEYHTLGLKETDNGVQ